MGRSGVDGGRKGLALPRREDEFKRFGTWP